MPPRPRHHHPTCAVRCVVTIDVHGPLDRVKDVSPYRDRRDGLSRGCERFSSYADDVPLLGVQRASTLSSARSLAREETLTNETDRPRSSFQRRPAKVALFQKTRMLSTATKMGLREDRSSPFPFRPLLHAAHTLTPAGENAFRGALQTHR